MKFAQKNVLESVYNDIKKKKYFPIKANDVLNVEKILDKIICKI